ncbi:MAG: carbamoyl-phosphate synthase large subunit [Acidobacteriota bacterium]
MPKRSDFHTVLIIGSGPVVIGQAGEYDYSGTQACRALKKLGYKVVLVNSNPAAVLSDPDTADTTYIEPLDTATVEKIISRERPDALLANFGGRTGLNLCMQLSKEGILSSHDVQIIGIPAAAMECAENRNSFKEIVHNLGIETPDSDIATSLEEAEKILERIDFPCAIRPSHAIAGSGGGLVYNLEEFRTVVNRGLSSSLIGQVLVEASVEGWDELELETIRDSKGQKITVCCIENIDGMGIHSGDSLSVTPMVTVSSELQNKLQEFAYTVLDDLDIVGCANFRFAHNSNDGRIAAIGLDPRTSRVSTLASKATGIPVAYTAALLAAGLTLDEIPFGKSGFLLDHTPARKSVAVKFPRWAFEKFTGAEDRLGAQMQAVGEVIGIGASFKEAFQKSIRSLENQRLGPGFVRNFNQKSLSELLGMLWRPTSERIFILYEALRKGADIEELREKTMMKPWFLEKLRELVALEEKIIACKDSAVPDSLVAEAKKDGFADGYLAELIGISEEQFRRRRIELNIKESFPAVDDSGQWPHQDRSRY